MCQQFNNAKREFKVELHHILNFIKMHLPEKNGGGKKEKSRRGGEAEKVIPA